MIARQPTHKQLLTVANLVICSLANHRLDNNQHCTPAAVTPRLCSPSKQALQCFHLIKLIKELSAKHLLADRGYDTNEITALAKKQGMKVQIPPKLNRKQQRA